MKTEELFNRLQNAGINLTNETCESLVLYHKLLMEWNQKMDLTAVTEESEMMDRHYVDSLMVLTRPDLMKNVKSVVDVGTGAGFPGMPIAIACPDIQVTLIDAQQKRLNFLQAVIDALNLKNVILLHARAQDAGRMPSLRERFDLAVARAVAPLNVLCEYLLPFVKVGGAMLCWKGPNVMDELDAAKKAAFLCGGKLHDPIAIHIPGRDWQHMLVPVTKSSHIAKTYPRKAGTPSKKPLGVHEASPIKK